MKFKNRYFYVSSIRTGDSRKIGITDTADNVEEYYSLADAKGIIDSGVKVYGLELNEYNKMCIERFSDWSLFLLETPVGTPMRLQVSATSTSRHVIYMGSKFNNTRCKYEFYFFDGSGETGYFSFSAVFIAEHKLSFNIDLNNLNPEIVSKLTKQIKENNISID